MTTTKTFAYDHTGRLLETLCRVNDEDPVVLNASTYNELGELVTKYLHSDDVNPGTQKAFVQKIDYNYNIRGWLTAINDPELSEDGDLFGMRLYYNKLNGLDPDRVSAGPQFNGNISAMAWGTAGDPIKNRGYGFEYDDINRLKTAKYGEGVSLASNKGKFSMSVPEYDKNGNIKKLKRYYDGTLADNLSYYYVDQNGNKSNRLQKVTDPSGDMPGMADYVERPGTYNYDANGNMIYDPGKGGNVKYNYLNLPERINLGTQGKIYYHYDAMGNKLAKYIENNNSSENTTTEYIANLVYTNTKLSFLSTEEGRAVPIESNGTTRWHFEYNLKDHLGNTRVTFGGSSLGGAADIVQTSSYYPFGMVMTQRNFNSGGNSYQLNKYLYNGKELQDDDLGGISLNWYDYGARFYDPSLGRFHTQDRFAEKYFDLSPYQYTANNPINYIDVNGDSIVIDDSLYEMRNGKYVNEGKARAFELFALTEEGQKFIKDRAQAGFELKGKFYEELNIKVEGNGSMHDKGIDVKLKIGGMKTSYAAAELDRSVVDGRLKIESRLGTGGWGTGSDKALVNYVDDWSHELLLHGVYTEKSFLQGKEIKSYMEDNTHPTSIIHNSTWGQKGVGILQQTQKRLKMSNPYSSNYLWYNIMMVGAGYQENLSITK